MTYDGTIAAFNLSQFWYYQPRSLSSPGVPASLTVLSRFLRDSLLPDFRPRLPRWRHRELALSLRFPGGPPSLFFLPLTEAGHGRVDVNRFHHLSNVEFVMSIHYPSSWNDWYPEMTVLDNCDQKSHSKEHNLL